MCALGRGDKDGQKARQRLARAPHGTGAKKVLLSREGQEWAGVATTGCPARAVVGLSGAGGGSGPGAAVQEGLRGLPRKTAHLRLPELLTLNVRFVT